MSEVMGEDQFDFNVVNAPIRCIPAIADNRYTIIVLNRCLWCINIMPPVFKIASLVFNLHLMHQIQ